MDGRTERNLQEKERRMEKKELKLRLRGLLAIVLAFGMMFGTSMTVLAARTYQISRGTSTKIDTFEPGENNEFKGGDEIEETSGTSSTGGLVVYCNGRELNNEGSGGTGGFGKYTLPGDSGNKYKVNKYIVNDLAVHEIYFVSKRTDPSGSAAEEISGNAGNHKHSFQWIETLEPTLQNDGLMQHKCECGAVDDQYIIPGALAYFRMYCAAIQNAPQNGTVEWNPYNFRCYTRRMMEELAKRPDVTLTTTYTEADGTVKSFTIPAGQAPADSEQFYGFTYLGNLYGWN